MYKHQKILMYEANILDHLMHTAKRGQKNPSMIQIINYERNVLLSFIIISIMERHRLYGNT